MGQLTLAFLVGFTPGIVWGLWPLIVHFYRHGLDNHDCHRECCDGP